MSNDQQGHPSFPEGGPYGAPPAGGWGGEYDADATAFIQLPGPGELPAADHPGGGHSPLAAPGTGAGWEPPAIPPMTPAASTDPTATGQWTLPFAPIGEQYPQAHPGPGQDGDGQGLPQPHPADPGAGLGAAAALAGAHEARTHDGRAAGEPGPAGLDPLDPATPLDLAAPRGTRQWDAGQADPGPLAAPPPGTATPPPGTATPPPGTAVPPAEGGTPPGGMAMHGLPPDFPTAPYPGGHAEPSVHPADRGPAGPSGAPHTEPDAAHDTPPPDTAAAGPGPEAGEPAADPAEAGAAAPDTSGASDGSGADAAGAEAAEAVPQGEDEHPLASYVLHVNGSDRPVSDAWIGESLLYVLRERLGLAGAKDGCAQGECGACSVQVDGRLVASCLVPAATAAESEIRTVEGLAKDGEPSDVQRALGSRVGAHCGFCVPGMAMTAHDLLEGNHAPTELEVRKALCGNLCRCSGYRGVLDAVREVAAARAAEAEAAYAQHHPQQQPGRPAPQPNPPHSEGRVPPQARSEAPDAAVHPQPGEDQGGNR